MKNDFSGWLTTSMHIGNGDAPVTVSQLYVDGDPVTDDGSLKVRFKDVDITDTLADSVIDHIDAYFTRHWVAIVEENKVAA